MFDEKAVLTREIIKRNMLDKKDVLTREKIKRNMLDKNVFFKIVIKKTVFYH